MADATSLTPPRPGLSITLFPNKSVESFNPKGPENVKITLYRRTARLFRAAHCTTTAVVISKYSEKRDLLEIQHPSRRHPSRRLDLV